VSDILVHEHSKFAGNYETRTLLAPSVDASLFNDAQLRRDHSQGERTLKTLKRLQYIPKTSDLTCVVRCQKSSKLDLLK
jgi:hypothetical protein